MNGIPRIQPSVLYGILSALRATDGAAFRHVEKSLGLTVEPVQCLAAKRKALGDLPFRKVISELAENKYYDIIMRLAGKESFYFAGGNSIRPLAKLLALAGLMSFGASVKAAAQAAGRLSYPSGITLKRSGRDYLLELNGSPFVHSGFAASGRCSFYCGFIEEALLSLCSATAAVEETACAAITGGTICHFAVTKRA